MGQEPLKSCCVCPAFSWDQGSSERPPELPAVLGRGLAKPCLYKAGFTVETELPGYYKKAHLAATAAPAEPCQPQP